MRAKTLRRVALLRLFLRQLPLITHSPPLQNPFSINIQFQLDDAQVTWTDPDRSTCAVDFFFCDAFDVDDPFFTVDGGDAAFAAFVAAAGDEDFVVFAEGD